MRLIDANAFFDKLEKLAELMRQGKIGEIDLNLLIASMPTVDAVPAEKYNELKERYKKLIETADILDTALRQYQRQYGE